MLAVAAPRGRASRRCSRGGLVAGRRQRPPPLRGRRPGGGGRSAASATSPRAGVAAPPPAHLARLPLPDDGPGPGAVRRAARRASSCSRRAIPFVSNVTGTWITAGAGDRPALLGAAPARARCASPTASRSCCASRDRMLLEVGPGTPSPRLAGSTRPDAGHAVLSLLRRRTGRPETSRLLTALGRALASPARQLDWRASMPASGGGGCRCRPTPSSAGATGWSRTRRAGIAGRAADARAGPAADWFYAPVWRARRWPRRPGPARRRRRSAGSSSSTRPGLAT